MRKEDIYARTMHTPDDPARAELRALLRETWKQLLPLHRALIDSAREEYNALIAPVSGPTHMIELLQREPFFAWLKPLTSLILDVDSMARTDFERADVDAVLARIEALFGANAVAEFAAWYVPVLQRDVDVAIAHAALRQLLLRFPS
jgi:hypothetical protein